MAEISLIRVDSRLIHGQVITKWRKIFNITKIVVVDDSLANDEFMIRMYEAAAPAGVKDKGVWGLRKQSVCGIKISLEQREGYCFSLRIFPHATNCMSRVYL